MCPVNSGDFSRQTESLAFYDLPWRLIILRSSRRDRPTRIAKSYYEGAVAEHRFRRELRLTLPFAQVRGLRSR
jgi:hypothetical protein